MRQKICAGRRIVAQNRSEVREAHPTALAASPSLRPSQCGLSSRRQKPIIAAEIDVASGVLGDPFFDHNALFLAGESFTGEAVSAVLYQQRKLCCLDNSEFHSHKARQGALERGYVQGLPKPGLWSDSRGVEGPNSYNEIHGTDFSVVTAGLIDLFNCAPERPLRILDIGCGRGKFLEEIKDRFGTLVDTAGLTLTDSNSNEESKQLKEKGVPIHSGSAEDLPFGDESFHLIISTYALCYAFDPVLGVEEAHRVLAPGGAASLHFPTANIQRYGSTAAVDFCGIIESLVRQGRTMALIETTALGRSQSVLRMRKLPGESQLVFPITFAGQEYDDFGALYSNYKIQ